MIRLSYTIVYSTWLPIQTFSLFIFWFKPSLFSKIQVKCQTRPRLLIFHSTISLPHKKFLSRKFLMTSLHVICGLRPQSKIGATPMKSSTCIKPKLSPIFCKSQARTLPEKPEPTYNSGQYALKHVVFSNICKPIAFCQPFCIVYH